MPDRKGGMMNGKNWLKRWGAMILGFFTFLSPFWSAAGGAESSAVHPCAGAGRWFPADPGELRQAVEGYLKSATVPAIEGRVEAVVVPHAGYEYSGATAAFSYRLLQGRPIKRVIVLAPSHSTRLQGGSVLDVEAYETPLGRIPVDRPVVEALLKDKNFQTIASAHRTEHSDENQLPFLQCVLGEFKMVSIIVGGMDPSDPEAANRLAGSMATAIKPFLDEQTVLVVSSDFTHYGAAYGYEPFHTQAAEHLKELDGEAAYHLLTRDGAGFLSFLERSGATICGSAPLTLMLKLLSPQARGVFLSNGCSSTPQTSRDMAVDYFALGFVEHKEGTKLPEAPPWIAPASARAQLTEAEQKTLLTLARDSIAGRLGGVELFMSSYEITPRLMAAQGAFVTLREGGDLRGCIGNVVADRPLYQIIIDMARQAAFGDPRFAQLSKDELTKIHIEISALLTPEGKVADDPLQKLASPDQIRLGTDGLTIRRAGRGGLLLPQVPGEFGWTRDQFLTNLCGKAGLPPDAWHEAEIKRFSAQIFAEPGKSGP